MRRCRWIAPLFLLFCNCNSSPEITQTAASGSNSAPFPLVTIDPAVHAYCTAPSLYDCHPSNRWRELPLLGVLRVDGVCYRFLGVEHKRNRPLLPSMSDQPWRGKTTFFRPAGKWAETEYDDTSWETRLFRLDTTSENHFSITPENQEIWIRRRCILPEKDTCKYLLKVISDGPAEWYLDGQKVAECGLEGIQDEIPVNINGLQKSAPVTLAIHGLCPVGSRLPDAGIYADTPDYPVFATAARQTYAEILPTRTQFRFACGPIELHLSFSSPLCADDKTIADHPLNYIAYDILTTDGAAHNVQLYLETEGAPWCTRYEGQPAFGGWFERFGMLFFRCGSLRQSILHPTAPGNPVDWGYFYLGADAAKSTMTVSEGQQARRLFSQTGTLTPLADATNDPIMSLVSNEGITSGTSGYFIIGYDRIYPVRTIEGNMRPKWTSHSRRISIEEIFAEANAAFDQTDRKGRAFDRKVMSEATAAADADYAASCARVFRCALSGYTIVQGTAGGSWLIGDYVSDKDSTLSPTSMLLASPLILYTNPAWGKALLEPAYVQLSNTATNPVLLCKPERYPLADAPAGATYSVHDLNALLILTALYTSANEDWDFAKKYWPTIRMCAKSLMDSPLEEQDGIISCILRQNTSIALEAVTQLAEQIGEHTDSRSFRTQSFSILRQTASESSTDDIAPVISLSAFQNILTDKAPNSHKGAYAPIPAPENPAAPDPCKGIVFLQLLEWKQHN